MTERSWQPRGRHEAPPHHVEPVRLNDPRFDPLTDGIALLIAFTLVLGTITALLAHG